MMMDFGLKQIKKMSIFPFPYLVKSKPSVPLFTQHSARGTLGRGRVGKKKEVTQFFTRFFISYAIFLLSSLHFTRFVLASSKRVSMRFSNQCTENELCFSKCMECMDN